MSLFKFNFYITEDCRNLETKFVMPSTDEHQSKFDNVLALSYYDTDCQLKDEYIDVILN